MVPHPAIGVDAQRPAWFWREARRIEKGLGARVWEGQRFTVPGLGPCQSFCVNTAPRDLGDDEDIVDAYTTVVMVADSSAWPAADMLIRQIANQGWAVLWPHAAQKLAIALSGFHRLQTIGCDPLLVCFERQEGDHA